LSEDKTKGEKERERERERKKEYLKIIQLETIANTITKVSIREDKRSEKRPEIKSKD